jgi:hypothetical protein
MSFIMFPSNDLHTFWTGYVINLLASFAYPRVLNDCAGSVLVPPPCIVAIIAAIHNVPAQCIQLVQPSDHEEYEHDYAS